MTVTLDRGVAVISIDTELAWGEAHRRGGDPAGHDYRAERQVIDQMLAMFAHYEISATWAVVGHLFLDRCESSNGRAHPEIVRTDYPWLNGDWYDIDPTSNPPTPRTTTAATSSSGSWPARCRRRSAATRSRTSWPVIRDAAKRPS